MIYSIVYFSSFLSSSFCSLSFEHSFPHFFGHFPLKQQPSQGGGIHQGLIGGNPNPGNFPQGDPERLDEEDELDDEELLDELDDSLLLCLLPWGGP